MARKRFNHSKLKVVGKKRKLLDGDYLNYLNSLWYAQINGMPLPRVDVSGRELFNQQSDVLSSIKYKPEKINVPDRIQIIKQPTEKKGKEFPFWKNLGKGIESIASKTSSTDPQDPSNAFFGGKYVAGVELGANLLGKKYDRGVKGAQTVNSILDAIPFEQIDSNGVPIGAFVKGGGKDLAALAQQAWGYKYNDENIAKVEDATAAANNNTATYNNYDAIMNANFNHTHNFSNDYIGDQGWVSHGIDDKAGELRLLSDRADKREHQNLVTSIDQTSDALLRGLNRNWTAYGGRLRRPHKFVEGGAVANTGNPSDIGGGWFSDMGNLFSKGWFQHAGKGIGSMYKSGQLNGAISAAGDFAYKGLSGGMNTNVGVGNAMNKLGDVAAMVPGPYGAIASAALKTVGGLTNRMFGSKLNYENINEVKGDIAAANANTATLNDYDSIMNNNWNNANYVSKSYIGKDGRFSNKAKKTWRNLMTQVGRASDRENLAQAVSTEQVGMNTMKGLERQWAAYGGKLNRYGNGGKVNKFGDGGDDDEISVQEVLSTLSKIPGKVSNGISGFIAGRTSDEVNEALDSAHPTDNKWALTGDERAYYHNARREAGQKAGTYREGFPTIRTDDDIKRHYYAKRLAEIGLLSSPFAWPIAYSMGRRNLVPWVESWVAANDVQTDGALAAYVPATEGIIVNSKLKDNHDSFADAINHAIEYWNHSKNNGKGLPKELYGNYVNYILKQDISEQEKKDQLFYLPDSTPDGSSDLRATLSNLKDFTKKLYGDEMTMEDISDDTIDNWMKAVDDVYTSVFGSWIKTLNKEQKQQILDYMNDPRNVAQNNMNPESSLNGNQRLAAEGGDLQSPRTAIDAPLANRLYMNKAANNVRRAANAMGLPVMSNPYLNTPYAYGGKVNKFDGTEDSWLLGGVGIAADRTGKPLGYMVQENYDPSSYEYNALGKEADQYISKRFPMNHIPILIGLEKNEW